MELSTHRRDVLADHGSHQRLSRRQSPRGEGERVSVKPEVLDALVAAGASAEMIVAAIKADAAGEVAKKAARREKDAERQRRHREKSRDVTDGHDLSRVTERESALPSLRQEFPPAPPSETQSITPPSPPKGAHGSTLSKPNGFARFWEAYPNKVGKRAAESSFDKALRRAEGENPSATILAGLERAKVSRKWDEGFIPNPATWLNQDRWLDEPAAVIPIRQGTGPPSAAERAMKDRAEGTRLAIERLAAQQ